VLSPEIIDDRDVEEEEEEEEIDENVDIDERGDGKFA
jgi:hypothetical protein